MHLHGARLGRALIVLFLLAQSFTASGLLAATPPTDFSDELVANLADPTALAFTPDGRLLLTQQTGQLQVYQGGALAGGPKLVHISGDTQRFAGKCPGAGLDRLGFFAKLFERN